MRRKVERGTSGAGRPAGSRDGERCDRQRRHVGLARLAHASARVQRGDGRPVEPGEDACTRRPSSWSSLPVARLAGWRICSRGPGGRGRECKLGPSPVTMHSFAVLPFARSDERRRRPLESWHSRAHGTSRAQVKLGCPARRTARSARRCGSIVAIPRPRILRGRRSPIRRRRRTRRRRRLPPASRGRRSCGRGRPGWSRAAPRTCRRPPARRGSRCCRTRRRPGVEARRRASGWDARACRAWRSRPGDYHSPGLRRLVRSGRSAATSRALATVCESRSISRVKT